MTCDKKRTMWTVFIISLLQMVGLAVTPALNQMKTVAFPQVPLSGLQTVLALSSLVMPGVSLLTAAAIRRGIVTKKSVVVTGLFILGTAGFLSLFLHAALWHLAVLAVLSGCGAGCYLTTAISFIMDRFEPAERRKISGYQSIFVNSGAVLAGLFGGVLAAARWYGGYLVYLVGIPVGVAALVLLPKESKPGAVGPERTGRKAKLKPAVFFYAATVALFMLGYAACSGNLAVHMAESGVKSTAVVGTLTSFQMVGGALFGFVFGRFSAKFKDYTLAIAFGMLFLGLTILNVFHGSLVWAYIGVFFAGISISMLGPQCIYSASHHVDATTSALASSLINGLAPGLGSFLSPVIFTNLTTAIAGESTNFRYQFVAFFSLACGIVLAVLTAMRTKRARNTAAADVPR